MSEPTPADPSITDGASSNGGGLSKLNNAPAPPPSASYPSPHFFHAPSDLPSGSSYSYPPPLMQSQQRSEEHTSELQSRSDLVCRLLLEKKKKKKHERTSSIH